jgi:cardiolipin synthase
VYFAAITRAEKHIGISSPYFVPDPAIREAIRNAALRGVKIDILTQGWPPETYSTYFASRYYWEELLQAGVRIFEYRKSVLHGKGVVVDGQWAAMGSTNLDPRSLQLNFEVMALLDSPADANYALAHIEKLLAEAIEIKLDAFSRRGPGVRALESAARLLGPVL